MVVPKSGISIYTFHTPREKFGLASKNAVLPRYLPVFDYTQPYTRKPFNDMLTAAGCRTASFTALGDLSELTARMRGTHE